MKYCLPIILFISTIASAQLQRYDNFAATTTSTAGVSQISVIPNATITVFNYPGAGSSCAGGGCVAASTFTSRTGVTACGTPVPLTRPTATTCIGTSDSQGNFGFWAAAGVYQYCVTAASFATQCFNVVLSAPLDFGTASVFTNGQMNENIQSLLTNCSPLTEMQSIFGTSLSTMTEAITGCVVIPSSSTVFQANAVSGWNEGKSNTTKTVGVSGWAQSTAATPTGVFGGNFGATDCGSSSNANCNSAIANANMFGVEIDCNLNLVASQCHNILIGASFAAQPTASYAIQITAPNQVGACTTCAYPFGLWFGTNATAPPSATSAAIFLNQSRGGGGDTQAIFFQGGTGNGWLMMKNNGDLQFASNTGGGQLDLLNSGVKFEETTAPTAGAAKDVCYGDSTAHALKCNYNNATPAAATFANVPLVIASGTAVMTTAAITAPACGTTVTVAATNVATTDTITWAFNAAPAGTNAGIVAWPTANNVNFAYCPGVTETPAAATLNWKVIR